MTATIAATLDTLIAAIRAERLDDIDLADLAASIDACEVEYIGRGADTWSVMSAMADTLDASAEDIVDQVMVHLGW